MTGSPDPELVSRDVSLALAEDIGEGDCTAGLVHDSTLLRTRVICRQNAVLAGQPWFDETFRQLSHKVSVKWNHSDSDRLSPGGEVCRLQGPARSILTGERTALNFLQTLSATASLAHNYVEVVASTETVILDTRKTIPGLRMAQKYAVRCGGASSHRSGLFDAILIKENHIKAVGSISAAVKLARSIHPELLLEVEVENMEELEEAVRAAADRVLLDNFDVQDLQTAVRCFSGQIQLEASGNVSLASVLEIAQTGVDFISVGDLTKNVKAVDFSMRYI